MTKLVIIDLNARVIVINQFRFSWKLLKQDQDQDGKVVYQLTPPYLRR
jgi:hypothetical protein